MMVCYHEVECHAEKLVLYLQCQDHSEGLYNHNATIFTMFSQLLVCLQPKLGMTVLHHKPECSVQKMD